MSWPQAYELFFAGLYGVLIGKLFDLIALLTYLNIKNVSSFSFVQSTCFNF